MRCVAWSVRNVRSRSFLSVSAAWRGHVNFYLNSGFWILGSGCFCASPRLCGVRHPGFLRGVCGNERVTSERPGQSRLPGYAGTGALDRIRIGTHSLLVWKRMLGPLTKMVGGFVGFAICGFLYLFCVLLIYSACCFLYFPSVHSYSRFLTHPITRFPHFRCAPSRSSVSSPPSSSSLRPIHPATVTRPRRTTTSPRTSSTTSVHSPPPPQSLRCHLGSLLP